MNLREALLEEHSKAQCNKIADYIGNNRQRYNELVKFFLYDEYRVAQRAAWPLSYITINYPHLVKRHLKKIIDNLKKPNIHNAVKRNTVRFLQEISIPQSLQGEVMHICFAYVEDPKEAVAVKAFSLTILGKLAKQYPEIMPEIRFLVEDQIAEQTPAFTMRANKILKEIAGRRDIQEKSM